MNTLPHVDLGINATLNLCFKSSFEINGESATPSCEFRIDPDVKAFVSSTNLVDTRRFSTNDLLPSSLNWSWPLSTCEEYQYDFNDDNCWSVDVQEVSCSGSGMVGDVNSFLKLKLKTSTSGCFPIPGNYQLVVNGLKLDKDGPNSPLFVFGEEYDLSLIHI